MNRAEIIEGLKEVYYQLYAITDHRKTIEACLQLLENENDLFDQVLEIIDDDIDFYMYSYRDGDIVNAFKDFRKKVLALKGEQG